MILSLFSVDWIAFIFSLASRSQTEALLKLFYPQSESLGLALLSSVPIVLGLLLISQRERLWNKGYTSWSGALLPLILMGVIASICVQFYHIVSVHWGFELITAIKVVVSIISLYCISRSRHLRWMIQDWKKPHID